jgi:hypothetical protein
MYVDTAAAIARPSSMTSLDGLPAGSYLGASRADAADNQIDKRRDSRRLRVGESRAILCEQVALKSVKRGVHRIVTCEATREAVDYGAGARV